MVPWPAPTDASAVLTVVATRQVLNALKLSCRTLKHVAGACSSSLSSAAENANTRLRIDEDAGDCALRNDSEDDPEDEDADENADEAELAEDAVGELDDDLDRR